MTKRTRFGIGLSVLASAGLMTGVVVQTQATAAPKAFTTLSEAASQPIGIGDVGVAEKVKAEKKPVKVKELVRSAEVGRGGCTAEYGVGGECLPLVPPSQAEHVAAGHMAPDWSCGEVRRYFTKGIELTDAGVDPHGLDANADGVACGKGD